MSTNFLQQEIDEEGIESSRPLHQSDIPVGTVKNRHIDGYIINVGLSADRPDGSTRIKAYFATDTGVLSIWDGTQWLSTTLS